MKFLCPTLWLGGLNRDNYDNNDDEGAGHTTDKSMIGDKLTQPNKETRFRLSRRLTDFLQGNI